MHLYDQMQRRDLAAVDRARSETTAASMISVLEDAIDIGLRDGVPTGQDQAYVATLVDAGLWMSQTQEQQIYMSFPVVNEPFIRSLQSR